MRPCPRALARTSTPLERDAEKDSVCYLQHRNGPQGAEGSIDSYAAAVPVQRSWQVSLQARGASRMLEKQGEEGQEEAWLLARRCHTEQGPGSGLAHSTLGSPCPHSSTRSCF